MNTVLEPLLLSSSVARSLGVSKRTLARYIGRGEIRFVSIGRSIRFRSSDVADFVEARVCQNNPRRKGMAGK